MRAAIVRRPGGPDVLELVDLPLPEPPPGWVLIEVKAFGLNRSELLTRAGHSPGVRFPRVLGLECVGSIAEVGPDVPYDDLVPGGTAAALMGGMGREFDGAYAEYACVPATQVVPVGAGLGWEALAALPETFVTAHGSLVDGLRLQRGQTLLVRGGSSSVGMAAITIAKDLGATVIATTRDAAKAKALADQGADHVVIDRGGIADSVRRRVAGGADRTLELVGAPTLADSLAATAAGGIACMTGILGGWEMERLVGLSAVRTVGAGENGGSLIGRP